MNIIPSNFSRKQTAKVNVSFNVVNQNHQFIVSRAQDLDESGGKCVDPNSVYLHNNFLNGVPYQANFFYRRKPAPPKKSGNSQVQKRNKSMNRSILVNTAVTNSVGKNKRNISTKHFRNSNR